MYIFCFPSSVQIVKKNNSFLLRALSSHSTYYYMLYTFLPCLDPYCIRVSLAIYAFVWLSALLLSKSKAFLNASVAVSMLYAKEHEGLWYNELWHILVLNTHLEEITHWPQYLSYRAIPIQDWFERWGRVPLNSSRSSCELIPTTVDLSDSLT